MEYINNQLKIKTINLRILKEEDYIKEIMECETIDKDHKIFLISNTYDFIKKYQIKKLELLELS